MTLRTLVFRSLIFHARSHLGTLLGAAIGTAVLAGALAVGDSVRGSLREMALQRLAGADVAMSSGDRFFTTNTVQRLWQRLSDQRMTDVFPPGADARTNFLHWEASDASRPGLLFQLPGTAVRQDGAARANQIQLLGVEHGFLPAPVSLSSTQVWLNAALARQLNARAGDAVIIRFQKPSALSRDAVVTPRAEGTVALRLQVAGVLDPDLGNFTLLAGQTPPLNAFLPLDLVSAAAGQAGRANVALLPEARWFLRGDVRHSLPAPGREAARVANAGFAAEWHLADAELDLTPLTNGWIQLASPRIFLDPPILAAIRFEHSAGLDTEEIQSAGHPARILTYLVNLLQAGGRSTPYSMVTATGAPWVPADMADDEIIVSEWLAEDLAVKPGDSVQLASYLADAAATLEERTNSFRVRSVVPMRGLYADRALMPEFPGIAKAESTHDWDAAFPLIHKIRDKDEAYWKEHRGTPKAFITLAAGQAMWSNRFGNLTAIRWAVPTNSAPPAFADALAANLRAHLDPAAVGLKFEPVRDRALKAVEQSQDFGGLFIGFSCFLIAAALALMWLLFQFSVEQRSTEVGTLLALGFTPRQVRRLLLSEGIALACLGGVLGVFAGTWYARAMVHGLSTIWRDAVGASSLRYFAEPGTIAGGALAGGCVAAITIWFALRRQARQPARVLLSGAGEEGGSKGEDGEGRAGAPVAGWLIGTASTVAALGLVAFALATDQTTRAGLFFGAGALLLTAGLGFSSAMLRRLALRSTPIPALNDLGLRNAARRRKRSLAVIGALACGSFLIASIGVFRLDANADAAKRSSGTGGFSYFAQSSLPIVEDLNTRKGRDEYALDERALEGVSFVPFRVRDGDDASCLNLNRAQQPRLLGVKPELLASRQAFRFARFAKGLPKDDPWRLLNAPQPDGAIPAIGDASSIQWALGKKPGDTVAYTDESGRAFQVRLVAGVANSILQGNLIISEAEFTRRFPREPGYRMFLIDAAAPPGDGALAAALTRALQDTGFEMTRATDRLASFNAVQNTYLGTFQALGGLGLLLGSAGLGVVVLRNVLERRGELAVLLAVGFRRRRVRWLVVSEHGALLLAGLGIGVVSALVAVLPPLLASGGELPWRSLGLTLGGVLGSGAVWTWLAAAHALRGELLRALRNE